MRREMRIVRPPGKIFVYPVPVVDKKKYLIQCNDLAEAESLVKKIAQGSVPHPDENQQSYTQISLHSDGETRILRHVQQ